MNTYCVNCKSSIKPNKQHKINTICFDCCFSFDFIPSVKVTKKEKNADIPSYYYGYTKRYRLDESEEYFALNKTEVDNAIQSPRYGYESDESRTDIIEHICRKSHLNRHKVFLDHEVEMFIDYGLINHKSDRLFFSRLERIYK